MDLLSYYAIDILKGYSLSYGEIAVDIRLIVGWGFKSWRVKDELTLNTLN